MDIAHPSKLNFTHSKTPLIVPIYLFSAVATQRNRVPSRLDQCLSLCQGLTLRFQARGLSRSFY